MFDQFASVITRLLGVQASFAPGCKILRLCRISGIRQSSLAGYPVFGYPAQPYKKQHKMFL